METQSDIMKFFQEHAKQEQKEKLERYRILNQYAEPDGILFTGSSLMEQFPVHELMLADGTHRVIYNRGVGGFTTDDMLAHMEEMVYGVSPRKIFLNIGTNDIGSPDYSLKRLMENYEKIVRLIQEHMPRTALYLMAYYPVNETDRLSGNAWARTMFSTRPNENIRIANRAVASLAQKTACHFIDVNEGLTDENGRLKAEFTVEGIHMYANGYRVVFENMKPYL